MSDGAGDTTLKRLCQAMGHPARFRILTLLAEKERTVNELVWRLELEQPTVSKHLATLLKAGLVTFDVDGRCRCYALSHGDLVRRMVSSFGAVYRQMEEGEAGSGPVPGGEGSLPKR